MKKEIRVIDKQRNVLQITTTDERYYAIAGEDPSTGLPVYRFIPSVTWIAGYYPKGIAFYKWLADKGWDEAEAIKSAAGSRGSRVHQATEAVENGGEIPIDSVFPDADGNALPLSAEELVAIQSFISWHNETGPECLTSEMTVFGDGYAGTVDRVYRIGGRVWIVDIKTSQSIWEEMVLQVSAYSNAAINYKELGITNEEWAGRGLAILQVGYLKNKARWKFTEIEDKFNLFLMAKEIWKNENPNDKPKQIEIPLILKLKDKK